MSDPRRFNFDAPDCDCEYRNGVVLRNMCGHSPTCPVYQRWYEEFKMKCEVSKCLTPNCTREPAAALKRGLCMTCHSKAKKLVESGATTWDELVGMNLALPLDDGLFEKAFRAKKGEQ